MCATGIGHTGQPLWPKDQFDLFVRCPHRRV